MSFEAVNAKVVKVSILKGQPVMARRGAMLGYTGEIQFSPVSGQGGIGGMVGRRLAGESVGMMAAEGTGSIYYGHRSLHHHVINLNGGTLSVESDRLLAHDGSLQTSVVFLGSQGGIRGAVRGAVSGQGLFTTQLSGTGGVAVLAHGAIFELQVTANSAVHVDPQAYVAHTGQVSVDITASVGWREAVGRGSGEAFQLKCNGTGTVYVQASEQKI